MVVVWTLLAVVAAVAATGLAWRLASRVWSIPCPSLFAWGSDDPSRQRLRNYLTGTDKTLDRMGLKPGQRILEIGPGPGRLLIPAARRVLPGGEAVGIDIQQRMIDRLTSRARRERVTNLTVILGDATRPHVPEASFDLVYLCTVLGEIPDRAAALAQCYRALKPGGTLSITETIGDPHYQSRTTLRRLTEAAGFKPQCDSGGWWFFTANFVKP